MSTQPLPRPTTLRTTGARRGLTILALTILTLAGGLAGIGPTRAGRADAAIPVPNITLGGYEYTWVPDLGWVRFGVTQMPHYTAVTTTDPISLDVGVPSTNLVNGQLLWGSPLSDSPYNEVPNGALPLGGRGNYDANGLYLGAVPVGHYNWWSDGSMTSCWGSTSCPGGHARSGVTWRRHQELWYYQGITLIRPAACPDVTSCVPYSETTNTQLSRALQTIEPISASVTVTPTDAIPVGGDLRPSWVTAKTGTKTCRSTISWVDGSPSTVTSAECSTFGAYAPESTELSYGLSLTPTSGVTACTVKGQVNCHYYATSTPHEYGISTLDAKKVLDALQLKVYGYRASNGVNQGVRIRVTNPTWAYNLYVLDWNAGVRTCTQWYMDYPAGVGPSHVSIGGGCEVTGAGVTPYKIPGSLTPTAADTIVPIINGTPTPIQSHS